MRPLVYKLPMWVHGLILKLTGWRLVKITDDREDQREVYIWTKEYPLPNNKLQ